MTYIEIDYKVLMYMVIGIFGLVGFMRGWWKEAITTGLVTILLILLTEPDLAKTVIDFVEGLIQTVWLAVTSIIMPDSVTVQAQATSMADQKDYSIYIILLIILIVISYFASKIGMTQEIGAGARILGALLGIYNGFVIVSLVREFFLGRYLPDADMAAASVDPTSMTVEVTNMPSNGPLDEPTIYFLIGLGILVFIFAIVSATRIERQLKISRQPPPLHGTANGGDK